MSDFSIQPLTAQNRDWLTQFIAHHWGSSTIVSRGVIYNTGTLPGFVAVQRDERIGLVTYHLHGGACEIVSLDSMREGIGVGTTLIAAVKDVASRVGCSRLWLITSNDKLHALGFYQKRGFHLVAVHRNAIEQARKLKPQIPLIGEHGIPIRDEIELELSLNDM